jgi:hypothetical protein
LVPRILRARSESLGVVRCMGTISVERRRRTDAISV